jgi:hypothetical protein
MNEHKMACVLLLVAIAGMVFGTQKMRNRAIESAEARDSAKAAAESAELQRRITETNLLALDKNTKDLRETYQQWLPHFQGVKSPQQGEQQIGQIIRQSDVFVLSQRFEVKEVSPKMNAIIRKALVADLVFEDDYVKTLNWLGRLEQSLPSCRVTNCRLKRGDRGNNVRLELKVAIPILNQTEAPKESELATS